MEADKFPQSMEKKMKLIIYFKRYMSEHLVKAGGDSARGVGDPFSRIPHLHTWFRTTCAVVMHLTNGSVQVRHDCRIVKPGLLLDLKFSSGIRRAMLSWIFQKKIFSFFFLPNPNKQLNFMDHFKIILCPRMSAVTMIDNASNLRTYKFSTIAQNGCTENLYQKLRYAHEKLKRLQEKLN